MTIWRRSNRFDPKACRLADRHYSRQKPGTNQFMPPGSCKVFLADNAKAVIGFSWPQAQYVKHDWRCGSDGKAPWTVSIFRNEMAGPLASQMITEALALLQTEYGKPPELGCITFVNPKMVPGIMEHGERIKGFCFYKAGFRAVGETKKGLLAWQLLPIQMPAPAKLETA